MLKVYLDFKSPASYLALAPTQNLVAQTGIAVSWHPFSTIEGNLPKAKSNETVGESHRRVRAEARRATHIKYAAHQGIDLSFPEPRGETSLALGAMTLLGEDPTAFMQAAFETYWTEHANLDDVSVVNDLLATAGYALTIEDAAAVRAAMQIAQTEAEENGIVDAPAYLIDDQLFIGREHWPWINEIIQSKLAV